MKNPDEAIDKVLSGLRAVEPASGMERRILAAVHQRAAVRRTLPVGWFALGGLALAVAAVVALLATPRPVAPPAPIQAVATAQVQSPPREPAPARPRLHTPAVRANAEIPLRAASFPAPPMPLTEQERLLVQVAQRGQPAALPVLDPDALAQQETHSEQVFEAALAAAQPPSLMILKEDIR